MRKSCEADLSTTAAVSDKEQLAKISENQKRIAEIDTQISEKQLENQKRIAEVDGQLAKAKLTRQYQELRAPRDGVVFDLQPNSPGFVASASEPVLKVVPSGGLVASVFITNKDIGFVKEEMPVDVKLESFPQSEFGSLEGKLSSIGSDALPPTQERPFYAFPAKIAIDEKSLISDGKPLPLQSGMAVNASIKVRKRTVMSLFTGMFDDKVKSLESVR